MIKSDILVLNQNLNKLGNLTGVKFAYGVSRNLSLIKPEIESLQKALEPSEAYQEFEKERIVIVEKYAKKDDKGKPIKYRDEKKVEQYEIEEGKQEELDKEFEILKIEHQEAFDAREKQIAEYNELLKTESSVILHKIALADVPQNISVAQMYGISDIIDESIPSPYPGK
jgi:hypothetical protein